MNVQQSREDADSYSKTATVDGQLQTEEWNKATGSGKFSRMVANRFTIEAEGSAASINELKSAVATVDPDDLTGALLFLLSEESRFVTGQNLIVDDGWSL